MFYIYRNLSPGRTNDTPSFATMSAKASATSTDHMLCFSANHGISDDKPGYKSRTLPRSQKSLYDHIAVREGQTGHQQALGSNITQFLTWPDSLCAPYKTTAPGECSRRAAKDQAGGVRHAWIPPDIEMPEAPALAKSRWSAARRR